MEQWSIHTAVTSDSKHNHIYAIPPGALTIATGSSTTLPLTFTFPSSSNTCRQAPQLSS